MGAFFVRSIILFILCLVSLTVTVHNPSLFGQEAERRPAFATAFLIEPGISEDGSITEAWEEAIRGRHSKENLSAILATRKTFTEEETLWADLIRSRIPVWSAMIDSLRIPFKSIAAPDTVLILLGNQGGSDAFVYLLSTMCFGLHRLNSLYGSAAKAVNRDRIDRFFAHEYTHLLHKAWRRENELEFESPLDIALWACLTEGLGNYRSLSNKWVQENGELTGHAKEVLNRLQPVFVERISALAHASNEEADSLMEGLSMGAFEEKWGALTVALWLAQEAKGDDVKLQKWVDAGPYGVLTLAQQYLPEELKETMPSGVKK